MVARVMDSFTVPLKNDFRTGRPASALRVATPLVENLNHLLGNILGGVRHVLLMAQETFGSADIYLKIHRHPNCDHLDIRNYFDADISVGAATMAATLGTGATVNYTHYTNNDWRGVLVIRVPWGSSDTGVQQLHINYTGWGPKSVVINDVPRETLDVPHDRVEVIDSSYTRIGLAERKVIGQSTLAGPKTILQEIKDAWDNYHPTIYSWATDSGQEKTVGVGLGWQDLFLNYGRFGLARQKKSTESYRTADVHFYTSKDSGVTNYQFRATSALNTVTSGVLTGSGWQTALTGLQIGFTDTSLSFEMTATGSSGDAKCRSICVIGDP